MALTTEVADRIYEIQPEGNGLDRFPLSGDSLMVEILLSSGNLLHLESRLIQW